MKKVLWLIVCLMTMVTFTSCGNNDEEKIFERFNICQENFPIENSEIVKKALKEVENYYYLHGKYELSDVHFLKTKLHVMTDSLVVAEIYARGKNSFDGGTISNGIYIYLQRGEDYYFQDICNDKDQAHLYTRLYLCETASEKNKIFGRIAINGYMNDETDWESLKRTRTKKDKDFYKDKKMRQIAIKYSEEQLGIN